jgi:para-nitrobenzyl esterase
VSEQDIIQHQSAAIALAIKYFGPLVVGSNKDEATFFTVRMPPITMGIYQKFVRNKFVDNTSKILEIFPANSDEEAKRRYIYLHTGYYWAIPVYKLAKALGRLGGNVYVYRFNHLSPKNRASGLGVSHGEETPYVFGRVDEQGYDEEATRISEAMMKYWIQFCSTGNPNLKGLPEWPRYTAKSNKYLEFDALILSRDYANDESFRKLLIYLK